MNIRIIRLSLRLSKYFREHLKLLFSAIFMLLITTGTMLARPVILKLIIDNATTGSLNTLMYYCGIFILLLLTGVAVGYVQILVMSKIGLSIVNRLKEEIFSHILSLDLSFFDKNQTGWLISRVESDCEQLKNFCSHITVNLITNIFMFTGILGILYFSNAKITMYMVGILICIFSTIFIFLGKIRGIYDNVRSKYAELTGFITEYIQGIPIIQHYNQIESIRNELEIKSNERYVSEVKASFYEYGFWAFILFFVETVLIAVILYFGITNVINGSMSLGTLVMFIEFSRQITWPIITFSEIFNAIQRSFVAAERIFTIMDTRSKIEDSETEIDNDLEIEEIEFKNINFSYTENEPVLKNINFSIKKGERIALVGPSGSGKSTTANLLCRFYNPDSGEILVNNQNINKFSLKNWRSYIGLVLQDIYLFPGSILDNIRVLNTEITEKDVRDSAEKMKINEFIENFKNGYDTELVERGGNLSMGERQLLCFARALSFSPSVLILDEATSSVDPYTEKILQESLDTLLEGKTAIIVAHRLSTIVKADKILVFENGEIIEYGNHEELLKKNGLYKKLYKLQFAGDPA